MTKFRRPMTRSSCNTLNTWNSWIKSITWPPSTLLSVFCQPVHMNGDVEGWHCTVSCSLLPVPRCIPMLKCPQDTSALVPKCLDSLALVPQCLTDSSPLVWNVLGLNYPGSEVSVHQKRARLGPTSQKERAHYRSRIGKLSLCMIVHLRIAFDASRSILYVNHTVYNFLL